MSAAERIKSITSITQALCDVCAVSEDEVLRVLSSLPGPPRLINLEPMTLAEVFDTVELVGEATDEQALARAYRAQLEARVDAMERRPAHPYPSKILPDVRIHCRLHWYSGQSPRHA